MQSDAERQIAFSLKTSMKTLLLFCVIWIFR